MPIAAPLPPGPAGNTLAGFSLSGRRYLVFRNESGAGGIRDALGSSAGPGDDSVVGWLLLHGERYAVVPSAEAEAVTGPPPEPGLAQILTKRELQIVMLVARGRVNKQIADDLKISEWTVSTHLRRIFAKLSVDSRAAMVYLCSELLCKQPAPPEAGPREE